MGLNKTISQLGRLSDEWKRKTKSNDTSGYPLRSEQEQIPSPNHLLPFQLKPYNNASHNQQYAYTRQRRQWETRFCFFRLYIHHFRLTEYQRTNTVSLHNDRAPCRFQHIKKEQTFAFVRQWEHPPRCQDKRSIPNSSHSFPFVHR